MKGKNLQMELQRGPQKDRKKQSHPKKDKRLDEEIAYQNKDIASKVFAESLKGKSFQVYGLKLPEIRAVLPTNIPAVKANELRLDNIFELADDSVAVVDYESEYNKEDKVKYLNYLAGISSRYLKEKKDCPRLRMIVIYTGDIIRDQAAVTYDIGAVKMTIEPAFLSELDPDEIFRHLKGKVERGELLDDRELMELIILPLSCRKKEMKKQKIQETVFLAANIRDRKQQTFALAGLLTFTDKLLDNEMANKIKGVIRMTKVARLFEEEKQQAVAQVEAEKRQALAQVEIEKKKVEKEKKKVEKEKKKAEKEKKNAEKDKKESVLKMIKKNYPSEEIISIISGFSLDDIEVLRTEITNTGR